MKHLFRSAQTLVLLVALTMLQVFDADAQLIQSSVANLPTSGPPGMARLVTDGLIGNDCAVGEGVFQVLCIFDGVSTWNSGGGGGGSLSAIANEEAPEKTEGAETPLSTDLNTNLRVVPLPSSPEDITNQLMRVSGGAIRPVTIMTGVTTNTTSATQVVFSGAKTPMASVTGTGALTATVQFYGDMENTTTDGEPLCPAIVLTGTTKAVGFCPQVTKDYPYYHAVTTVVTGTNATVEAQIVTGTGASKRDNEWISSTIKTADALIKTGYGWLQCIWIAQSDAAPTAGTISVNDAVSAGTGTPIFTWNLTTAVFTPFQICPQVPFTAGLYFDFTTTADVNVSASYR